LRLSRAKHKRRTAAIALPLVVPRRRWWVLREEPCLARPASAWRLRRLGRWLSIATDVARSTGRSLKGYAGRAQGAVGRLPQGVGQGGEPF
jgi:hypothetical protein